MNSALQSRIHEILDAAGAYGCVECGKCTAVCPMARIYPDFSWQMSPRGLIRRAVTGEALLDDPLLWRCTGCNAGTAVCPEKVSCRDLVAGLRRLAVDTGRAAPVRTCAGCGTFFVPLPLDDYLSRRLGEASRQWRDLCPVCRQRRYALYNT